MQSVLMQLVWHLVGNQIYSNPTSSSCIKLLQDSDIYIVCFMFCSIVPKVDYGYHLLSYTNPCDLSNLDWGTLLLLLMPQIRKLTNNISLFYFLPCFLGPLVQHSQPIVLG